jgi:hypothetical protein
MDGKTVCNQQESQDRTVKPPIVMVGDSIIGSLKGSVCPKIYIGYLQADHLETWYPHVKQKSKPFFVCVNFLKKMKEIVIFLENCQNRGTIEIYFLLWFSSYNIETHII